MENRGAEAYKRGFIPYALAAFLIGIVGGFSTVLGPAFVQEIGISYNNTTWTALAQAISTAACAPVLGKLGDVIGRRKTLLLGIGVFTLGNIFTALAGSLLSMMAARFVVGLGTAAIAPVILSYIVTEFPSHAVAKGFSLYMLISSASVIFGPTLGGWMIAGYGWRVMIWLCAAVSLTVLLLCTILSGRDSVPRQSLTNFDVSGAILVFLFFSLALCIPSFGQNFGWGSAAFLTVAVAAVVALTALVQVEKRAKFPILPGSFMKRKRFILSVAALFLTQGLMQANMTNCIVFVNMTRPNDTVISGYAISILYLGMSFGSVLLGPLADRIEPKTVLTGSLALTGLGCAVMLFFSATPSVFSLALSLGILGFGLGGNGTIFMKVVLSGLPAQQAGAGTGTYGLFRDLAAPFGVAVLVPLFTNRMTALVEHGAETAGAAVSAVRMLAMVEIFCVAAGIVVVRMLPRIHPHKTQ
ncbi:MAG: MFS transporter [Oscillospiraceae bacterium]|nr:MFS transporter [Oscillospiraceae bacterium]